MMHITLIDTMIAFSVFYLAMASLTFGTYLKPTNDDEEFFRWLGTIFWPIRLIYVIIKKFVLTFVEIGTTLSQYF